MIIHPPKEKFVTLSFGDILSNAIHEVKQHTGKKISIVQDDLGYTFDPIITGDTIESWRYRKRPPTTLHLERLAESLVAYGCPTHDREWLTSFLQSADHPYPDAICDRLFPDLAKTPPNSPPLKADLAPPPLTSYQPPTMIGFVGRAAELAQYQNQLETDRLVVIVGMAGVGKTSLASLLASTAVPPGRCFWHSFYDADLMPFIRRLAGFVAGHGRHELWESFEAARIAGTKPPDIASSFDTLMAHLDGLDLLLCLDDLQFVDDDPRLQAFLQRIASPVEHSREKKTKLLMTSRRLPTFLPVAISAELKGLTLADAHDLLEERDVDLSSELTQRLHEVTEGNGAFLTLAAVVLRQVRDAATLIDQLATVDHIERFLMQEVNDRLSTNQQRVMEAMSVLSGYPGTRDVLEVMLNQRGVRRTLRELTDEHLLTLQQTVQHGIQQSGIQQSGEENEYSQHHILQSFYYDQPTRAERRTYHQRAGEYYAEEMPDPFKALLHYTKGALAAQALAVGQQHLWQIVNQGQARSAHKLIEELADAGFDHDQRLELLLIRGQLGTFLGEYEDARTMLEAADRLVGESPSSDEAKASRARISLAMAKLLERSAPPDALEWAYRGLEVASTADKALLASLKIQAGTISLYMGNLGGAMETLHDGLDDLSEEDSAAPRIDALTKLGLVNFRAGSLEDARKYTSDALALSKQHGNHFLTADAYINSGPIKYVSGDWPGAVADLEEGLSIAQRLGSRDTMTALHVNLGGCYINMGKDAQAFSHLNRALDYAKGDDSQLEITTRIRLAEIHNERHEPDEALEILEIAQQIAEEKNDQISLSTVYGYQGQSNYVKKDYASAMQLMERAIEGAKTFGDRFGEGQFLRFYGQIAVALNDIERAQNAFQLSLAFFRDEDEYEEALTLLEMGKLTLQIEENDKAIGIIEKAQLIFSRLGASRELAKIHELNLSAL